MKKDEHNSPKGGQGKEDAITNQKVLFSPLEQGRDWARRKGLPTNSEGTRPNNSTKSTGTEFKLDYFFR